MKTLRLLTLLIIFCCAFSSSRAQYVTIPDSAFASYLRLIYPACMNGSQMDTTCPAITSAPLLMCRSYGVKNFTGVQYFDNLNEFVGDNNSLAAIPVLPSGVTRLSCYNNKLTAVTNLPVNLTYLQVSGNLITSLPALPASVITLSIGNNQITGMASLPPLLEYFDCMSNKFTTLPVLPASLTTLNCSYNLITALPATLPPALEKLDFSGATNQVTTLPPLPATLRELGFQYNKISSLPATLPPALEALGCGNNLLSGVFPLLPASMIHLSCQSNNITSFSGLPPALRILYCQSNALTQLPPLPSTLEDLDCRNNLISSIPQLPDPMHLLYCEGNPNLHCLPRLTTISYLRFDSTTITCLPNYGIVDQSYPQLGNVPLCDPFNANGCQVDWSINGNAYNDSTVNCLQDNSEPNIPYLKVNLLQNNAVVQQAYTTVQNGVYAFDAGYGSYTIAIDTVAIPFTVTCPVSGIDSADITVVDSLAYGRNFGLQCKPGFDVAAQSISCYTVLRPARFNTIKIKAGDAARFYNQSCNTQNLSGQLVTTISGPLHYISPAPGALTPTVSGNTLTYTIADWSAINPETAFNIITQTDTTAQSGTAACFNVTVAPTAGDNYPQNNTYNWCFSIVNSYDPNIKEVYPVSDLDITGNRWLTYTVRFQNTGNAPAEHIYITDTIDTDVDIETFQLLAYSFQPQVIIKGNAVRFNFVNINLPDSISDEPNSHGYVQYKVKVKDSATQGTVITNTAFIYFDFNAPVVTNTTTNTLTQLTGITTIANGTGTMQVYPNPANNVVMINLSDNLTGGTLTLSDVTGRSLTTIALTAQHNELNTGALSSGVYLVTATKGGVRVVQRVTISH